MQNLFETFFAVSPSVRYIAVYRNGNLQSRTRSGLENASSSESDKYEELIVNPTLLTLVRQRGDIDCGGAFYLIVRYGHFFEYVQPINGGHISVGLESDCEPVKFASQVQSVLVDARLIATTQSTSRI